jgi:hypothetical protein
MYLERRKNKEEIGNKKEEIGKKKEYKSTRDTRDTRVVNFTHTCTRGIETQGRLFLPLSGENGLGFDVKHVWNQRPFP